MKSVCVIIPIYKPVPSGNELRSIRRCIEVFAGRVIVYAAAYGFDASSYPPAPKVNFDAKYFSSVSGYSELCCSAEFYQAFLRFDYILICQPDCWVFKDSLDGFLASGYDYIGAPWFSCRNVANGQPIPEGTVGNGGFSLRKTATFFLLAKDGGQSVHPEDVYWCINRASKLNIAPVGVASRFSLEHHPERGLALNFGCLPMGCHKPWQLKYYHFWHSHGVPEYID